MLRSLFLLMVFSLVTGCASVQHTFCNLIDSDSYVLASWARCQTMQFSFDYDSETDFSRLASYDWMPVQTAVTADFDSGDRGKLHDWVTVAVDDKLAGQGFRLERQAPDMLVGYNEPKEMTATLELEFVDAGSRKPIWRGISLDEAYPARNSADWEKRVRMAVDMLLQQFPPSSDE